MRIFMGRAEKTTFREAARGLAVVAGAALVSGILVIPLGIGFDKLEKSISKPRAAFQKQAAFHETIRK